MPSVIRQKNAFKKMEPSARAKFLVEWVAEIKLRCATVLKSSSHTIDVIKLNKRLIEESSRVQIIVEKVKPGKVLNTKQLEDFDKRCLAFYETFKSFEKEVFGYERDVMRPNSDGAKKHKLVVDLKSDITSVQGLLEEVRLKINLAVNLYDSYGSNKDILESVNKGRQLSNGLSQYVTKLESYLALLEEHNAKYLNIKATKEALAHIHNEFKNVAERSEAYVKAIKLMVTRYHGVTRKIAKEVGVLKTNWTPEIRRKLDASGRKSGTSATVKKLQTLAYSGAGAFPNPASIFIKLIQESRFIPDVKELAKVVFKISEDKISESLANALGMVKSVLELKERSPLIDQDVATVVSIIANNLSDPRLATSKFATKPNKDGVRKLMLMLASNTTSEYRKAIASFVSKNFE